MTYVDHEEDKVIAAVVDVVDNNERCVDYSGNNAVPVDTERMIEEYGEQKCKYTEGDADPPRHSSGRLNVAKHWHRLVYKEKVKLSEEAQRELSSLPGHDSRETWIQLACVWLSFC